MRVLEWLVMLDLICLWLVNILGLGETMVVDLLGSVAAWITGLLSHQLHLVRLLLVGGALIWEIGVRSLLFLLLGVESSLGNFVWVGCVLVPVRVVIHGGHVAWALV